MILRVAMVVLVCTLAAAAPHEGGHPHWSYEGEEGPAHWAGLDPQYATCEAGHLQSPIDIRDATAIDLSPLTFSYRPSPLRLIDNGHTIQVTYAPGSYFTVGDHKYVLQQFHFHHPAEEKVQGKSFPLVVHLVHKDDEGKLAVVAVLLEQGEPNPTVDNLWKHLPSAVGEEVVAEVTVNATALLPPGRGYYTFVGSLTTPPCTEGVTWFVLKDPSHVSRAEVAAFARKYPNNARPIQPANGRAIEMTR